MTPEQAAHITAICQLKHRYAWAYDTRDLDGLVELFTEDAECDFGPFGSWTGRDELRAGYTETMKRMEGRFPGIHIVANPIIDLDGDTATGRWYLLDEVFGPAGEHPLKIVAVYHERYRREPVGWRIAYSRIEFLWAINKGRLSGGLAATPAPPAAS